MTILTDPSINERYERALEPVKKEFGKHHPMHIGADELLSEDGEFVAKSPIDTRIVIGYFQKATQEHVRKAIDVARSGFRDWSTTSYQSRCSIFEKVANALENREFELAAILAYEIGKKRTESIGEVSETIAFIRYYCDQMRQNEGYMRLMGQGAPNEKCVSVMKPYGVWAAISPFNAPIVLGNNMCAGALLTGNTVVFKPTSDAPLSSLRLYQIYREAGIPPRALSFITAPGEVFGKEVTSNPSVAGIGFTGSKHAGLRLYKDFAKQQPWPKPFVSETGSKNPCIVSEDADIDKAVAGVLRGAFTFQGQKCSATSRVYVQREVYDKFVDKLVAKVRELTVGNPTLLSVSNGPVINARSVQNFRKSIDEATKAGGNVMVGGRALSTGDFRYGHYVQPTVITGLPQNHHLFKDELFVPILLVADYSDLEDAIELANGTEYGLTAGIFSGDKEKIEKFFNGAESGVCYANREGGATTGAWPGAQPFVGWKGSGCTGKGVGGPHYLLSFMHEQSHTTVEEDSM